MRNFNVNFQENVDKFDLTFRDMMFCCCSSSSPDTLTGKLSFFFFFFPYPTYAYIRKCAKESFRITWRFDKGAACLGLGNGERVSSSESITKYSDALEDDEALPTCFFCGDSGGGGIPPSKKLVFAHNERKGQEDG